MVDKFVIKAFIMDNIGYNVIPSPSLIAMCKAISNHGYTYALPSYSTLRKDWYLMLEKMLSNIIQ